MLDIGLEIRILRERLKISAKELAEKVGLSQSQMSRLEKGQRRIDTQVLGRIAAVLQVDPSHFFGGHFLGGSAAPAPGGLPAAAPRALGKLLRSARRRRHLSAEELASRLGRTKAVIQQVEEGKRALDPELAEAMRKALKLPASFLLQAQEQVIRGLEAQVARLNEALAQENRGTLRLAAGSAGADAEERRGIPLLGTLADGYPQEFDAAGWPAAEAEDFLFVPLFEGLEAFAVHAVGDSMECASSPSFGEGDVLVFAAQPVRSRDFAFVRRAPAAATFRQVYFEPQRRVRLQPLNLAYPPELHGRAEVLGLWKLIGHLRLGRS